MWFWTSRPGFDSDLVEELAGRDPKLVAPSLVSTTDEPEVWPTFARMGFELIADVHPDWAAYPITDLLTRRAKKCWHMQSWVPDADETNRLSAYAREMGEAVSGRVGAARPEHELRQMPTAADAIRLDGLLVQMCHLSRERVLIGVLPARDTPTQAPGGRARTSMPGASPSRAARKLQEAFEWIRRRPERGEVCVDLGAAPGGWTVVLLQRHTRVIAVDPAKMAPALRDVKKLQHVQASAFDFEPEERVDWLFCDMAWRPMEVAALLAKWGKRRWADTLVANLKLPMKQRVLFTAKLREAIAAGGWKNVRTRQLYHDREEITLSAWRT